MGPPHGLKFIASKSFASLGVTHMASPNKAKNTLTDGVQFVAVLISESFCMCCVCCAH